MGKVTIHTNPTLPGCLPDSNRRSWLALRPVASWARPRPPNAIPNVAGRYAATRGDAAGLDPHRNTIYLVINATRRHHSGAP